MAGTARRCGVTQSPGRHASWIGAYDFHALDMQVEAQMVSREAIEQLLLHVFGIGVEPDSKEMPMSINLGLKGRTDPSR